MPLNNMQMKSNMKEILYVIINNLVKLKIM
jgi:hypothetical protein